MMMMMMMLWLYLWILLSFQVILVGCFRFSQYLPRLISSKMTRKSSSSKIESTSAISQLLQTIGPPKSLLQLLSQEVFSGRVPVYTWESSHQLNIQIPDMYDNTFDIENYDGYNNTNSTKTKEFEQFAVLLVLKTLLTSPSCQDVVRSWVIRNYHKKNRPKSIKSIGNILSNSSKSLIIMVDAENIGDFTKYSYIDVNGEIRLSHELLPSDDTGELYRDDDILILTYAHASSHLCDSVNRLTIDSQKNAADSKFILFSLL